MAEYSGSALYVALIHAGGTATFSGDYRTFRTNEASEEIDATAGSDSRRVYLAGPSADEATLEYVDQASGTVNWAAVVTQTAGTLKWAPEGTAAGKQLFTQACVVLTRERAFAYNDVPICTVNFRLSGAQTAGTA